jgi:hypothetical protein
LGGNLRGQRVGNDQIERLRRPIDIGVAERRNAALGVERDRRKRPAEEQHPLVGADVVSDLLRKPLEGATVVEKAPDLICQHHERNHQGE